MQLTLNQRIGVQVPGGALKIIGVFIATVILAAATSLLALTSLVAVITWRENRRRDREEY